MMHQRVAEAFHAACMAELSSLKPGNVHIFADGHGMVVQEFIHSADAVAGVIAQPGLSVGQRILVSVEATWQVVSCNTNLGIVLLCAPLIHAALSNTNSASLREKLQHVLAGLDIDDATLAFKAIARASPGGLGEADAHDVHEAPTISLLVAMQEAAERDRIAWQYAHGFEDIFGVGVESYTQALRKWENPAWAATVLYLTLLSEFPDSHIQRKYDQACAAEVSRQAAAHLHAFLTHENPKFYQRTLLQFDAELKAQKLNPGTSADLTVATLLAHTLSQSDAL